MRPVKEDNDDMTTKRINTLTALFFVVVYGVFFFGLKPLLFAGLLPIALVALFLVMMAGTSFMITLFFYGYLLYRAGRLQGGIQNIGGYSE